MSTGTRPPVLHLMCRTPKRTPPQTSNTMVMNESEAPPTVSGDSWNCRCKNTATSQRAELHLRNPPNSVLHCLDQGHLHQHNRDIDYHMYGNWDSHKDHVDMPLRHDRESRRNCQKTAAAAPLSGPRHLSLKTTGTSTSMSRHDRHNRDIDQLPTATGREGVQMLRLGECP